MIPLRDGINSESFPWLVHSVQETSPNFLEHRTSVDGTPHNADSLSERGMMTSSGHAHLDSRTAERFEPNTLLWAFHTAAV